MSCGAAAFVTSSRIIAGGVEGGVDFRLFVERLELLADALQIGLAHRVHELALELGRHSAHLADDLADGAHDARQVLRRDHRERDDRHHHQLAYVEVEHRGSGQTSVRAARKRLPVSRSVEEDALSRPCERRWRRRRPGSRSSAADRRAPGAGFSSSSGEAFLERFHALGDVAHDVGDLALAAEQQQRHRAEQHPVPNAEATHGRFPDAKAPPGFTSRRRDPRCREPKRGARQKQACHGARNRDLNAARRLVGSACAGGPDLS